VLGCKLRPDGTASRQLRRRVALGVELYRAGRAPLLLLSGGGAPVAESEVMAELARAAGVPATALLCEDRSRNTAENAVRSARLLRARGLRRIVLVSQRAHLFRAGMLFRLAGLDIVEAAGVPATSTGKALVAALYEAVALPRSVFRVLRRRG
jgi:uncharacterized SAM-binding protein YcdF (DUF218 family)